MAYPSPPPARARSMPSWPSPGRRRRRPPTPAGTSTPRSRQFEQLRLTLLTGADLLPRASGDLPDPYVTVTLGPSQQHSRVVRGSAAPEWRQTLVLPLGQASDALHVTVWDRNKVQGDQFLGSAIVDLGGESASEGQGTFVLRPRPYRDEDEALLRERGQSAFGQLALRWGYEGREELRLRQDRVLARYAHLQVTLVAACNLAAAGSPYHRIDPCARLSLGDQLQDTAVVPDTRFPAWDLIAPFDLNDDTRELRVSVWDTVKGERHGSLGAVAVDLGGLGEAPGASGWFMLHAVTPDGGLAPAPLPAGEVLLRFEFARDTGRLANRATKVADFNLLLVDVCRLRNLPVVPTPQPLATEVSLGPATPALSRAARSGVWDETVRLAVTAAGPTAALRLTVRSVAHGPRDDVAGPALGQAVLDVSGEAKPRGECWLPLRPCRRAALPPATASRDAEAFECPEEVLVRWEFRNDSAARLRQAERRAWCHTLRLEVARATLPTAVEGPAVFAKVRCRGTIHTTRLCRASKAPWWRETCDVRFAASDDIEQLRHDHGELPPDGVLVEVFQVGAAGEADAFLGEAAVDALGAEAAAGRQWVALHPRRLAAPVGTLGPEFGSLLVGWQCLSQRAADEEYRRRQKLQVYSGLKVWLLASRNLARGTGTPAVRLAVAFGARPVGDVVVAAEAAAAGDPEVGLAAWEVDLKQPGDVLRFSVTSEDGRVAHGEAELDVNAREETAGVEWLSLRLVDGMAQKVEDLGDVQVRWKYQLLPSFLPRNLHKAQLAKLLSAVA